MENKENDTEKRVYYFPVLVEDDGPIPSTSAQDPNELNSNSNIRVHLSRVSEDMPPPTVNRHGLKIPEFKPTNRLDEIINHFDTQFSETFKFINHAFADLDTNGARTEDIITLCEHINKLCSFKVTPEEWQMIHNMGNYKPKNKNDDTADQNVSNEITVHFQKHKDHEFDPDKKDE